MKKYIKIYENFLGKSIYIIFFFSMTAALMEAFGLLMVIPILGEISGNSISSESHNVVELLKSFFYLLDLDLNMTSAIIFFIIFFILKGCCLFLALCAISYFRGELLFKLKLMLYEKVEKMDMDLFLQKNSGHFVNLVNEQTLKSINGFNSLGLFLSSSINLLIYLGFAMYIEPYFALVCILLGSLFFLIFKTLNKKVRSYSIDNSKISGQTSKFIIQLVNSFKYLRATNQSHNMFENFEKKVMDQKNLIVKTGYASSFTQSIRDPIAVILMMGLIYWQVIVNENPLYTLVVALALFYRALSSVLTIQISWQKFLENSGSLTLIQDEIIHYKSETYHETSKPVFRNKIQFKNVTLFRNDQKILHNINFVIDKGKTTAIIGKSGSGKTTILDLIMGIISPTNGNIMLDSNNFKTLNKHKWRNMVGYVSQDNVIFEGSIKDNIQGLNNNQPINITKLNHVIKLASLTTYVKSLKEGINTEVGDMGVKLSGGQKQRILIARELYREPEILILDEATSAIDNITAKEISLNIQNLRKKLNSEITSKDITIVIVAHKFSSIQNADRVIVLKDGQISENDNYENLANSKKSYLQKMYK